VNPDDFESATESPWCESDEVPGTHALSAALMQHTCKECGQLRLFLVLEDEAGSRMVHSFDENVAAYWGMLFIDSAKEMIDQNRALGSGFSKN
jgi:hypothetical protein